MRDFAGRIAVVTGGGTGMGRELVRQLVAEGCNVAMCDVSARNMAETKRQCEQRGYRKACASPRIVADVSKEAQVMRFRDAVAEQQETDKVHLLFNNAGIGGGGSMIANDREEWEKTFNICWGGVYFNTRAFLPMMLARTGPYRQHQQHQRDLGLGRAAHAAHRVFGGEVRGEGFFRGVDRRSAGECAAHQGLGRHAGPYRNVDHAQFPEDSERQRIRCDERQGTGADPRADRIDGRDPSALSDDESKMLVEERARKFLEEAPTTAAQAAKIILDGVKADRWRILVGDDAHRIDGLVRQSPERAYDIDFFENLTAEIGWRLGR